MTSATIGVNPVLKGLSSVMKREKFIKKANRWYSYNDETILVVSIHSAYGNLKFVNFAIWIKKLADDEYLSERKKYGINPEYPRENHCHIRFNLSASLPENKIEILQKLENINNTEFTDIEREKITVKLVEQYGMPLLKRCSTIKGIVEVINEENLKAALMYWKVKELGKIL